MIKDIFLGQKYLQFGPASNLLYWAKRPISWPKLGLFYPKCSLSKLKWAWAEHGN